MQSISLITGKKYEIPTELNDRAGIDDFIAKNAGKKVVVVQGLGFVGAVMSFVVSNALTEEYAVIGIDLPSENSYWKIQSINEGVLPLSSSDKKVEQFFLAAKKKGNLYATFDSYAYSKADVVVVDINLDVKKEQGEQNELLDYSVNLNSFKAAISSIAKNCKDDLLLLVETTVPPGTCKHVVKPLFEEEFAKRGLMPKYHIGHSYERVMPGPNYIDSIQNFYRVYSGINEESANAVELFLKTIIKTDQYPLTRLHSTTATEMAKVMENSFRAMNIAFIEEWGQFAEEAEVNLYEVVNAIRMRPTHKNIMLPGLGVGGYCLTKDPLLASWSKQEIFKSKSGLPQSETAVRINDRMPLHSFNLIQKHFQNNLAGKKILFLGVSYLNDVGDTRYTPVELLYDNLIGAKAEIALHDSFVNYWQEKDLAVEQDIIKTLKGKYDAILLSTMHSEYRSNTFIEKHLLENPQTVVFDLWGMLNTTELKKKNIINKIIVTGRGDL